MDNKTVLRCPDCGSDQVTVDFVQTWMANTDEHYCYSNKTCDPDTRSTCLDCEWVGVRANLIKAAS